MENVIENFDLLSEEDWILLIIYESSDHKLNSGKIYIKNQELNRSTAHVFRRDLGFLTENHGNYE